MISHSLEKRLEQYTLKYPKEVLLVSIQREEQEDQIIIFKGFSSSLTAPTSSDPDEPIFPENTKIVSIDRLASPYNPINPQYLERYIPKEKMEQILTNEGL